MATLIAVGLGSDFPGRGVALYAAATPRTGARDLVQALRRVVPSHWHIVNRADIVPALPPSVSPARGGASVFADFDRVVMFEAQSGSLRDNHATRAYLCAVVGGAACTPATWATPLRAVDFASSPGPA